MKLFKIVKLSLGAQQQVEFSSTSVENTATENPQNGNQEQNSIESNNAIRFHMNHLCDFF